MPCHFRVVHISSDFLVEADISLAARIAAKKGVDVDQEQIEILESFVGSWYDDLNSILVEVATFQERMTANRLRQLCEKFILEKANEFMSNLEFKLEDQRRVATLYWSIMEDLCGFAEELGSIPQWNQIASQKQPSYCSDIGSIKRHYIKGIDGDAHMETFIAKSMVYLSSRNSVDVHILEHDQDDITEQCLVCVRPAMRRAFMKLMEDQSTRAVIARERRIQDIITIIDELSGDLDELDQQQAVVQEARRKFELTRLGMDKQKAQLVDTEMQLMELALQDKVDQLQMRKTRLISQQIEEMDER